MTVRRSFITYAPDDGSGGGAVQASEPENPTNTPDDGTGGPQMEWDSPENPYFTRHREASQAITRLGQENSGLRERAALLDDLESGDPARMKQVFDRFGIEFEYENPEDTPTEQQHARLDPQERQLVEQAVAYQQQQEQARQEQQQMEQYRSLVDPQLTEIGVPSKHQEAVALAALELPFIPDGYGGETPDLAGAWQQLKDYALSFDDVDEVQQQFIERYRKTKKAPAFSASGTPGTQVPNLDTHEGRVAHAMDLMKNND